MVSYGVAGALFYYTTAVILFSSCALLFHCIRADDRSRSFIRDNVSDVRIFGKGRPGQLH